jgi:NAD(P)-dependent dehydrogenase (short-subunit alcohol dehydrogenase family)
MHPHDSTALDTEEGIWDLTMQINLKGVWWGCKHAIVAMHNNPADPSKGLNKGGSIINTASFVALRGAATPQLACSSSLHITTQFTLLLWLRVPLDTASKGGVLAMSRELAMVHAKEGIRVNALCPSVPSFIIPHSDEILGSYRIFIFYRGPLRTRMISTLFILLL